MEQKQIEENNVLIANFMGAVKSKMDGDSRYLRFKEPIGKTYAFYPKDLKYHSSWDWLHPVIEKIRELRMDENIDQQLWEEDENACKISHLLIWAGIDQAYDCVIDFIKWHNTPNK